MSFGRKPEHKYLLCNEKGKLKLCRVDKYYNNELV